MNQWSKSQLFIETIPRSVFFSYVQIFLLTGQNPSQVTSQLSQQDLIDPFVLLTQTFKNYQFSEDEFFGLYSNKSLQTIQDNNFGVSSRHMLQSKSPIWAHYTTNTNWYRKQIDIFKKLQPIYHSIPGIKNIYLTASSSTEISGEHRDMDIIIQAHKGWVWPVRTLTKTILKLQGRDVHSLVGEVGLNISAVFKKFILLQKQGHQLEQISRQKIFKFKNRAGLKIDLGLVFDDPKTLPKIFKQETRHLLFFTSLKINFEKQIPSSIDFFEQGDLLYEPYLANFRKIFWMVCKAILALLCIVFWPLIWLFYFYYYQKNKLNPNFLIEWGTVCFYPLIYKEGWFVKVR